MPADRPLLADGVSHPLMADGVSFALMATSSADPETDPNPFRRFYTLDAAVTYALDGSVSYPLDARRSYRRS